MGKHYCNGVASDAIMDFMSLLLRYYAAKLPKTSAGLNQNKIKIKEDVSQDGSYS